MGGGEVGGDLKGENLKVKRMAQARRFKGTSEEDGK
jgi:hypothetical protein